MKKYFSTVLCSDGYRNSFNSIYKKSPNAKVYLASGGDDYEQALFFKQLIKGLAGYRLTVFNPFFDDSADGIFIENLNTYILLNGGYNKINPVMLGTLEKRVSIVEDKDYPQDLLEEILHLKKEENNYYKNACGLLKSASFVREKIHGEVADYLNDDKLVNYINRLCVKILRDSKSTGSAEVRFLRSVTPLGLHTHFDTAFTSCDHIIELCDVAGFGASVLLGVVKGFCERQEIPFVFSPAYFSKDIPEFLILPHLKLCISAVKLPFESTEKLSIARFLKNDCILESKKIKGLLSLEGKFFDRSVLNVYEGRDCRFKYSHLTKDFSDPQQATENANALLEQIIK